MSTPRPPAPFDSSPSGVGAQSYARLEGFIRQLGEGLRSRPVSGVREKAHQDVVSDLDFWIEDQVRQFLSAEFPGHSLLSEESLERATVSEHMWVLDPLDGTVNCTSGVPFYAISLAELVHGEPHYGCVLDPVRGELFVAHKGQGAVLNGERIYASDDGVKGLAITSGVFRRVVQLAPERLREVFRTRGKLRNFGAQALHLSYVAAGRLSAAVSTETRLWDNAAGALLVQEAGGHFVDFAGERVFPVAEDSKLLRGSAMSCLATSPGAHQHMLALVKGLE